MEEYLKAQYLKAWEKKYIEKQENMLYLVNHPSNIPGSSKTYKVCWI